MPIPHLDRRSTTLLTITGCLLLFSAIFIGAWLYGEQGELTHLMLRKLPPSFDHPFGTDWLGRDMLARTLKGLRISLFVGLSAAGCSSIIALLLGLAAATMGKTVDTVVTWLVDVTIATPHLVLLILISFALGGGIKGVIIAVAVSHWPALTRIIRAEVMQLQTAEYVQLSQQLGKGTLFIARHHMLPHVIPQFTVGLLLLFPHAILHAAALTFLGFGMSPHTPAVGVLLAESMRSLSMGLWWLAVAPGIALVITVKAFDILGMNVRTILDPRTCRE
ncbi:ABC transporter permease [Pseudodesulfovibrio piezophilus]|uniref:Dipeptide ABC transporter, permease protein n=1 Tax=Pseudodesulfovibrio piezophilus (strain DSM 21447 / JCM 15486 / C1TLV30) TaxID=1322246 RepID=M1WVF3_PSEP2|nr:ABC transporter permease [Pseudodesulfovibrio piezophilus]CCH48383.1 Dipeptide ABC transporter, permease protein [Pseudodesulfovibrio piezophilus C1TLV30]